MTQSPPMKAGTYKLGDVHVAVNNYGCVEWCDDWETLYSREGERPEKLAREPHWGRHF